jgi:indole-3-glycerol phosphate synthase
MEALVEVHDEEDLQLALSSGAELIGINNRDLESFRVDLSVTERLAGLIPPSATLVAESGIRSREDVERMARVGVDACLVGEALVVLPEEELEVRLPELVSVPRCPRIPGVAKKG